jgi:CheY-like chemotaxis protein
VGDAASAGVVPKRVLIVDDDPDQVATFAELLRLMGHQVEYATNPLYALTMARDFHPQFIFLDIGLPYMDGYATLARFQTHFRGARFFAISGRSPEEEERRCRDAGFEAYFAKPVDPAVIERLPASGA